MTDDGTGLAPPPVWSGPSADPNDEQFGGVVEPTTLDSADAYDVVLVGEPYDGAVIGREGAAEGPAALREELTALKTHHFATGPVGGVGDLGDVEMPDGPVAEVQEAVAAVADAVHESVAFPVFLGGDNSLSYANARPLLDGGDLGVISFDAHLDCREVRDGPTSGTPYRQLHEAGLDAFAVLGARHFETSTAYHRYAMEQGATVLTAGAVADDPAGAVDDALAAMAGVDRIYVSVDVDVLDAAAAPGVSAPTPGGLSTRELFRLLADVAADQRVAGFEVVECAPPLDRDGMTARAGARAIAHFLAGRTAGQRGAAETETGEAAAGEGPTDD